MRTMKVGAALILCIVFLHYGASAPIGWSPQQTSNDKTNHGLLAGVATSADPSTVYSWLMKLFSQRGFMAWLNSVQVVTASPSQETSDSRTTSKVSEEPSTSDGQIERMVSGSPTIVRDYETQRSLTPESTNIISTRKATPEIARDYAGNDLSIIARTQKPSDVSNGQFVTPMTVISKNSNVGSQTAASHVANVGGSATPTPLGIVRDYTENKDSSDRQRSNFNVFPDIPLVQVKNGIMDETNTQISVSSSSVSSQTSVIPADLQIARDKMDSLTTVKSQQKETPPEGLVVIRDVLEDETQVPDHIVATKPSTAKSVIRMEENTLAPGSNLVVLLPKTGLNFIG